MEVKFVQNGKVVLHRKNFDFSTIDFFERFLCDFHYHINRLNYNTRHCYVYFYNEYNVQIAIDEFLKFCRRTQLEEIKPTKVINQVSDDFLCRLIPVIDFDDLKLF